MVKTMADPSAQIIALPGAASLPVVQPPRRGRFPKGIISLARFRAKAAPSPALPLTLAEKEKALMRALVNAFMAGEGSALLVWSDHER